MPAFQEVNPEPGNRVSARVSARVFLQGLNNQTDGNVVA